MGNPIASESPGTRIQRWFIADKFGPLILRKDGDQRDSTYSRRATSMDPEGKAAE